MTLRMVADLGMMKNTAFARSDGTQVLAFTASLEARMVLR